MTALKYTHKLGLDDQHLIITGMFGLLTPPPLQLYRLHMSEYCVLLHGNAYSEQSVFQLLALSFLLLLASPLVNLPSFLAHLLVALPESCSSSLL